MQMTGSSGGINSILAAHDQEVERKRRIEALAATVAGRWGFVSQEGVERCAKRLALDALWEDDMGDGKRMLTIAGTAVLLEVGFDAEKVVGCVLGFPGSGEGVGERAAGGAEVLRRDLQGEGYVRLEAFVQNMEILGRMDRLGGEKISCFDATDGMFKSLERLWRWEIEKERQQGKEVLQEEVMCRRSGRPRMHTRGRVGLALQYWIERRLVLGEEKKADEMDLDIKEAGEVDDETDVWSAIIECEAFSAELYPSIRVSDAWVSQAVEKPAVAETNDIPGNDSTIDWQEPSPTRLPQEEQGERAAAVTESNLLQQPKAPDVRFLARFEPPVVVPLQTALQIHNSVGSPIPQEMILSTTYENLLFADIDIQQPPTQPRTVEKTILSYDSTCTTPTSHLHRYSLFTQQQDWARAITHLPFSHPRQIIAILPILRQWALTGSILRRAFSPDKDPPPPAPRKANNNHLNTIQTQPPSEQHNPPPTTHLSLEDELAAFMASPLPLPNAPNPNLAPSTSPSSDATLRDIQITFKPTTNTNPLPQPLFEISFPRHNHSNKNNKNKLPTPNPTAAAGSLTFTIAPNGLVGGVEVVHNGHPQRRSEWAPERNGAAATMNAEAEANDDDDDERSTRMREKLKKVLEVGESVGVAVEWISAR